MAMEEVNHQEQLDGKEKELDDLRWRFNAVENSNQYMMECRKMQDDYFAMAIKNKDAIIEEKERVISEQHQKMKEQVKQTEQIRDDLAQVQGRKDLKQLRKHTWNNPVVNKKQSQLTFH